MPNTPDDGLQQRGVDGLSGLLLRHLPTTVVLLDAGDRVVASTGAGATLDDSVGADVRAAVGLDALMARARESGQRVVSAFVDVGSAAGRRVVRATVVPLRHSDVELLLHIEDTTAATQAAVRAREDEHLAHLGALAAAVAHEIRNPLAGISGAVQVVGSSLAIDDARRRALDKVVEQVQRLGALVGDLLAFAAPVSADRSDVDLGAVAADAAASADAIDGHHTRVTGAGKAAADPQLLRQVLLQLIENAWQAGANDVHVVVKDGAIDVVDDGAGVAADLADRVFEPFFTTKTRGTGLGLPVARRTIEAMGGTLDVVVGVGGHFALRLERSPTAA